MSTEQEQARKRLAYVLHLHHRSYEIEPPCETCKVQAANAVGSDDITVTLPPEPQWKPGQYVIGVFNDMHELFRRNAENTAWEDLDGKSAGDEVTDVEPVAVLTAEDVMDLAQLVASFYFKQDAPPVVDWFAERGVDVR